MNLEKHLLTEFKELASKLDRPIKLMEVCGTHTVNIFRAGIKSLLPENIQIVSGPGCPVCVTPDYAIDNAIELAKTGVTIFTFGDMVRVPGTRETLGDVGNYRVFYSPAEVLSFSEQVDKAVVLCVGFETTAPTLAWLIKEVRERKIRNVYFYALNKVMPPPLKILTADTDIDGFILPGHVSTIIGEKPYAFLTKPSVITGFEPAQILRGLITLLKLIINQEARVVNAYPEVVRPEGNPEALKLMYSVFRPGDAVWRGLGNIEDSGLLLKEEYAEYDAEEVFSLPKTGVIEQGACKCGEVLRGKITPPECSLFGKVCTPQTPKGACMVSSEGSCAAYFRFFAEEKLA